MKQWNDKLALLAAAALVLSLLAGCKASVTAASPDGGPAEAQPEPALAQADAAPEKASLPAPREAESQPEPAPASSEAPPADPGYLCDENSMTYSVYSVEGLQNIAALVNGGQSSIVVLLTGDIDLGGSALTPIGTVDCPFTGSFDGQGFEINGLQILGDRQYAGLFGRVGSGGTIQNLHLTVASVTGGAASFVGGVAGYLEAGSAVRGCTVTGGQISGGDVGGVAGYAEADALIRGCTVNGVQLCGESSAGGVAGFLSGSVTLCRHIGGSVSSGAMAGGLVGCSDAGSEVSACYHADGSVTGSSAGGVVGFNNGPVGVCWWSGGDAQDNGLGSRVTGEEGATWEDAARTMNEALGEGAALLWQTDSPIVPPELLITNY